MAVLFWLPLGREGSAGGLTTSYGAGPAWRPAAGVLGPPSSAAPLTAATSATPTASALRRAPGGRPSGEYRCTVVARRSSSPGTEGQRCLPSGTISSASASSAALWK